MIKVVELQRDDQSILDATFSYLMQHEATHCLQIGLFIPFATDPPSSARWWVALDNGVVVGVASRGGPFNLVLSIMGRDEAIPAFVATLDDVYPELPGVIGPVPWSLQFADGWGMLRGISTNLDMREAIYECTEVVFPERMAGSARFANEVDTPWMIPWIDQFFKDANMAVEGADSGDFIRRRYQTGGFVLWMDEGGEVVSLSGFANPTPNGIRIGPVYTPAEHRGHGYGVAVSAAVTQHLLDSGRSSVFLFADLDYPVSNHVYKKIGYRAVAEFGVYRFVPSS